MQSLVKTIASGAAYGVEEVYSKGFSARAQIDLWPRRAERTRVWEAGLALGSGSVVPKLVCTLASPKDLPNPPVPGLTPHIVMSLVSGVSWALDGLKVPQVILMCSQVWRLLAWDPSVKELCFSSSIYLSHPKHTGHLCGGLPDAGQGNPG